MTSSTEIANLALSFIGTRSTIQSLTEQSEEARMISVHYNFARQELLRAAYWNFARRQRTGALLRDSTQNQPVPQPWIYEYALPSDALMMRSILPQYEVSPSTVGASPGAPYYMAPPVRFLLSSDVDDAGNDITVILTNQPQALLIYTKDISNESLFDSDFVTAFARLLASKIAFSLTGDKGLVQENFAIADAMSKMAQARNGNEGLTVIDSVPDWMRVRGYASDWAYPLGGYFYFAPQTLSLVS